MKIQKKYKLFIVFLVLAVAVFIGINMFANSSLLEGRLNSVKQNPSMESMDEDELKPSNGMELEETRELKSMNR